MTLVSALLLFLATGSAAEPVVIDIAELAPKVVEFDGRTVRVRGWVSPRCYAFGCALTSKSLSRRPAASVPVIGLSIGYVAAFEPELLSDAGAEIVLEARVDATCHRGKVICTDRAPDLVPIRIIRVMSRAPDLADD